MQFRARKWAMQRITHSTTTTTPSATATDDRFRELDGLRGIAATWVMLFHFTFGIGYFWLKDQPERARLLTPASVNLEGLLAVDLFFMVSGFVIIMTIARCHTVIDFVVSRFARLYPVFWASLTLTAVAAVLMPSPVQPVSVIQYIVNLTMLQAYLRVEPVEGVYWSLSFEFGFYFLIALLFAAGAIQRIYWAGLIWLAVSFLSFKLFPAIGASLPYRLQALTILPFAGLFYAGIIFFMIRADRDKPWLWAALVLCYIDRIWGHSTLFVMITSVNFAIFALCVTGRGGIFASPPLVFLGTISYALYLLHYGIGFRVMSLGADAGLPPALNLIAAILVVVALASVLTFLVERPANRYIRARYRDFIRTRQLRAA